MSAPGYGDALSDAIQSPSEQHFRQRVRDLEACVFDLSKCAMKAADIFDQLNAENARLRRAIRVLARLQSPRVARAVMEVISDE